jgi:glycosyltransferase involved in cell wall biosynthesis
VTKKKTQRLYQIERYADILISHPYFGHFHERPCVNFLFVGIPYTWQVAPVALQSIENSGVTRILHAPSHPEAKGTAQIRGVVEKLRIRGYLIEYVEIVGKPNAEVIRELAQCDFVIDQLYSDTPMAGFAAEAAFMGKPTIVGGYSLEALTSLVQEDLIPPSHICHPDELENAVEMLITDVAYRLDLGKRANEFVTSKWIPRVVSERYVQLLSSQAPNEASFDPQSIRYIYGACISEIRLKSLVRRMIETGGRNTLQLHDKPALEALLTKFAES